MRRDAEGAAIMAALVPTTTNGMTPALADQWETDALTAIDAVVDPDEAERLLAKVTLVEQAVRLRDLGADREQRWGRVRLKAERRYGELLPPKQTKAEAGRIGGKQSRPATASDRAAKDAQSRARKVAAVPKKKFNGYVDTEAKPTRDGLLRAAGTAKQPRPRQRTENGQSLWKDESVIAWVTKQLKARRTREEIIDASRNGKDGWPVAGRYLPQNAADRAIAIVKDRQRHEAPKPAARTPTWNGKSNSKRRAELREEKRRQELLDKKQAGEAFGNLLNLQILINRLCSALETVPITSVIPNGASQDLISDIHDDMITLRVWDYRVLSATQGWLDDRAVREKIAKLRNVTGRTDAEAAGFLAVADELERLQDLKLPRTTR